MNARPPAAPLCTGGRCEQIMRAIAEGRHVERVAEDQGLVFAKILRSALGKLGVACNDVDTSAAVAAAIREVAAGGAVEPQ